MGGGWPLHHADPVLVGAAAFLFLIAYAFKAWGWQRLFREEERPTAGALAFAGGAACVGGVAMPGRVDDAIRIACVKRYPGTRAGLGTIGLSLIIVGMLDNAALAPLAGVAITDARSWTVRAGFLVVSVAGILAAVVVSMLPKFAGMRRVMRFRMGRWLSEHAQNRRESLAALLLISVSWALRGTAVFLLLNALALRGSLPARARLPLRVRRVRRGSDRPRRCGDAGRRRCDAPRALRRAEGRGRRVLGRRPGADRRHGRRGDDDARRLAAGDSLQAAPAGCRCGLNRSRSRTSASPTIAPANEMNAATSRMAFSPSIRVLRA